MIFKRWFKPKWQHEDAAIRLQAIETLQASENEHKNILHELAFNDGAEAVRKAALHRLDDFALWWQASKQDAADRMRGYAEQQLINQLLEGVVEQALKDKFIAQCNRSSVLEQLALKDRDPALRFALLQRLARPELVYQALADTHFPDSYKQQLLLQIKDEKQLEKLSKQLSPELAAEVNGYLSALAEEKLKPVKLRKELRLLLAKLNAVRERANVSDMPAIQQQLAEQWQQLTAEFSCLSKDESKEFLDKYQQLNERLTAWLAPRLAELAKQQAAEALASRQQAHYLQMQHAIRTLEQQLTVPDHVDDIAYTALQNALDGLTEELRNSELSSEQSAILQAELQRLRQQSEQLPQIAATIATLQSKVQEFSQQGLPSDLAQVTEAEQQLAAFSQTWRHHTRQLAIKVPPALATEFAKQVQQWQAAINELKQQQQKGTKQFRSKCSEFKRLHAAGRYNVLFGLYKGIADDFSALSEVAQAQLEKEFTDVSLMHAELESLQHYIATPRKQAQLTLMQELAATPVLDAKTRSEQVKLARQNWNLLGKAEPAADEVLNQAFDAACEAAFEPCRKIFAALDAERASHVSQRQALIAELSELTDAALDTKALEQAFRQIAQRWREAGAVNRRDYQTLQQQYQSLAEKIKTKINLAQQQHAAAKSALLDEAKAALTLTDAAQTATVLKELQQRWRTIGYAGRKEDQSLWQAFRSACDGFFAKRAEDYKQLQQAEHIAWQEAQAVLNDVSAQLAQADSLATVQALDATLRSMTLPDSSEARQQYQAISRKLEARLAQLTQQQQRSELQSFFALLAQGNAEAEHVPVAYREAVNGKPPSLSRPELTVALELVTGKDSGHVSPAEKQQVQLALLSLKHNAGQQLTPEQLLQQWLAHGAVAEQEQPLLKRVAALF